MGARDKHPSVLILDDEPMVTSTLSLLLGSAGYVTLTATNCDEAMEQLAQGAPDLVLSDVNMPCQNGLEFLQKLRSDEATARLPVILISARARAEDRRAGLAAGATAYIYKPFDPEELLQIISSVLPPPGTAAN